MKKIIAAISIVGAVVIAFSVDIDYPYIGSPGAGQGDSLYTAFGKVNSAFTNINTAITNAEANISTLQSQTATNSLLTTITNLSLLTSRTNSQSTGIVIAQQYSTALDGGGGLFAWDAAGTGSEYTGLKYGTNTTGRWNRLYSGALNVRWFGAKGDGSNDDTAEIQSALNYCSTNGGGVVYVPGGSYVISTILQIPDNTGIIGDGQGVTVFSPDWTVVTGKEGGYFTNTRRTSTTEGNTNIFMSGFSVVAGGDGTPEDDDYVSCMRFTRVKNLVISDVEISYCTGFAMNNQGLQDSRIENCYIHDVGHDGITVYGAVRTDDTNYVDWPVLNYKVLGNTILRTGDDGIAVHSDISGYANTTLPARQITIADNTIKGHDSEINAEHSGANIKLSGVYEATIADNTCEWGHDGGIHCKISEDVSNNLKTVYLTISGNTIRYAGNTATTGTARNGITLTSINYASIDNNVIEQPQLNGIYIGGANSVTLNDNTIANSLDTAGILVKADCTGVAIHGGSIDAADGNGIRCEAANIVTIADVLIRDANRNLVETGYAGAGIYLWGTKNAIVDGVQVHNISGSHGATFGLVVDVTNTTCIVTSSIFNGSTNTTTLASATTNFIASANSGLADAP